MAKTLTKLTAEQEALLPAIRDEWLAHGLSTAPADRDGARLGVKAAYEAAGLDEPKIVVWLESPLAGCVGTALLDQVGGQVWGQVGGQVRDQVGGQVRDQVRDQVWDQVGGQVWDQVRDQVGGQVRDQVRGQVSSSLWGQHDAGYMSFFDAFHQLGLEKTVAPTFGLRQVAKTAGWWWTLKGAAILTERPTALHRDAQGRLHNTTGPALLYPDGWGIWAAHGVRVPADVVEHPEALTVERILGESNTEIRRVMIELYGWERFADDGTLTLIDRQPDPGNPGQDIRLYELPPSLRDVLGAPVRLIVVTNATPERNGDLRSFGLTVPVEMADAVSAAAWTFQLTPKQYKNLARAS